MFVINNSKSFIPQILKIVSSLGEKLIYFSPLGFVMEQNCDSKTFLKEFKLNSFRAYQRYLIDKIQHRVQEQHHFFNFVHV